ncbi:hypothetical protein ADU37_CDS12900 [Thermococcus sp. 2319x1]|uniref:hypothetical protein n=1 Tax=Thermococcus sp. 2319x1 TaxID=1674923 RepID=UPI00073A6C18|nr:hypothetical protein [Thermococcus sp. 2319x1]ALV62989.1 hypothetical protein ADU37_CDS12900 [Thermococcus sp. 2319x1]
MPLPESDREALAIRWRRLLILGLLDFFNGANDFGKLIIKELVDMREAVIKAFAKSLGISLHSGNRWKRFNDILNDIYNHQDVSDETKSNLKEINEFFISPEFSFQQISYSLKDLRNEETHYLNISDIPKETIIRVWRKFYELVYVIDPDFFEYVKNRPEIRDFYHLQDFFKVVVVEGNDERISGRSIDLEKVKEERILDKRGRIKKRRQRNVCEMIEFIKSGKYLES